MNKTRSLIMALLVLNLLFPLVVAKAPTVYEYTLEYRFENRGTTDFTLTEADVAIPLFINTTGTAMRLVEISHDYRTEVMDDDGNKGIIVDVDLTLSPGEEESFTATYEIMSSELEVPEFTLSVAEGFDEIQSELVDEYCFSTETFPSDDPMFYDIASVLVDEEDTVLESVSNLVEYIVDETTYCNYETPQYPNNTLANHLGDCDDQSILLITMCRSLDIPAYLQVGIYVHNAINDQDSSWDDHLTNNADGVAWHGWAMVYIPPWGWVPVDLTMTNADSGLELIQSAPEYNSNIIPVLNVSKQPYIGGTLEARDRFINSSVCVTISDTAKVNYSADNPLQNYLLLGIGAALLVAIGLMFKYGNQNKAY
ncbi:MAG TPA: transglutaminase family protein [Candidatus Bathyarchaeota archaeon]|nr:transglutaminase family protein [Candidatus Bathyarchaeota archaeon]